MTRATLTHSILLCLLILMPLASLSIDDQAVETNQFDSDADLLSEYLELSSPTEMDAYDFDSEESIDQSSIDEHPARSDSSNEDALRALDPQKMSIPLSSQKGKTTTDTKNKSHSGSILKKIKKHPHLASFLKDKLSSNESRLELKNKLSKLLSLFKASKQDGIRATTTDEDMQNSGLNYDGIPIGSLEFQLTLKSLDGMPLKTIIKHIP